MRKAWISLKDFPQPNVPSPSPAHVRLSKACHLPGSVQNKPGEENRGKHWGGGGGGPETGPRVSPRFSSLLGGAGRRARRTRLARPCKSWAGEVQAGRAGQDRAGPGRAGRRMGSGQAGRAAVGRALAPPGAAPRLGWGGKSRGTHSRLSSGCSCRCMASEKPKRLPGSPDFRITLSSRVSRLKAAPRRARSPADR